MGARWGKESIFVAVAFGPSWDEKPDRRVVVRLFFLWGAFAIVGVQEMRQASLGEPKINCEEKAGVARRGCAFTLCKNLTRAPCVQRDLRTKRGVLQEKGRVWCNYHEWRISHRGTRLYRCGKRNVRDTARSAEYELGTERLFFSPAAREDLCHKRKTRLLGLPPLLERFVTKKCTDSRPEYTSLFLRASSKSRVSPRRGLRSSCMSNPRTGAAVEEDGVRPSGTDGVAVLRRRAPRRGGGAPAQVRGEHQRQARRALPVQVHREFSRRKELPGSMLPAVVGCCRWWRAAAAAAALALVHVEHTYVFLRTYLVGVLFAEIPDVDGGE